MPRAARVSAHHSPATAFSPSPARRITGRLCTKHRLSRVRDERRAPLPLARPTFRDRERGHNHEGDGRDHDAELFVEVVLIRWRDWTGGQLGQTAESPRIQRAPFWASKFEEWPHAFGGFDSFRAWHSPERAVIEATLHQAQNAPARFYCRRMGSPRPRRHRARGTELAPVPWTLDG